MFINLKDGKITVKSYRNPNANACELSDILEAVENETGETLVCSADGAADALCDGEYLGTLDISQATVEAVYNAIVY